MSAECRDYESRDRSFDVFVSHSAKDVVLVDALVHFLEERKIRCRYSKRDFIAGKEYSEQIVDSVKESGIVLFVLSANSLASPACRKELEVATTNGRVIIPYKVDDSELDGGAAYYLQNIHWINAFPNPEKHFAKLAEQIELIMYSGRRQDSNVALSDSSVCGNVARTDDKRDRFLRWLCQYRSNQMRVLVKDQKDPTVASWRAASRKAYGDLLTCLENERQQPASYEQFNRTCDAFGKVLERAIEWGDASFELNGCMSSALEILRRLPRGPLGRFTEAECDLMMNNVQKVFDLLRVMGEDICNVAESCHISFELPLLITALPKGTGLKNAVFVREGTQYRYKRTLFEALGEMCNGIMRGFETIPGETSLDVLFNPKIMYMALNMMMNGGMTIPTDIDRMKDNVRISFEKEPCATE